jgi:hypothetical protein
LQYNANCYGYKMNPVFQVRPLPFFTTGGVNGVCDFSIPSTAHSGSIQVSLADGSTRTVAQSIDAVAWTAVISPNGGEVVPSSW